MPAKRFALTVISARTALIALAIATFFASSASAQSTQGSKRVLILFTHQSDNPAQAIVEQALRSTLQTKSTTPVEMYSEYLDAVRTPVDNYEKQLVAQLQQKYAGRNFDLIFAVNPPALKLLLQNRATLFPSSPIVFLVLDQQNLNGLNDGPNLTGVWGEVNYKATLELALNLHPATRQVVVISGVGEWDNYWRSVVQQELRPFEARVVFSYLTGLTVAELQKALAGLPPQTIVLFVSSTKDREGNNPGNLAVIRQICPVSSAPVYGNSDAQVGLGIVGGKVVSFEALGLEAAQVGLRVMNGEKPGAIAPHGIASVPMFDSRELKRWGINESSLPPGAIVKFKQVSLWESYKWTIIGLIAAVILEGLLIVQLLNADRKRRRAEQKTKRADQRLREIVSNVPGMVWETVIDKKTRERKTTFVSDYVRTMLGYTPEEWLAQPPGFGLRLMADEDRERARADTEAAISSGKDKISEHRWRAKDGRLVWIESHLSPVLTTNGVAEGLRGVSLDITERKLAEETVHRTEEKSRALLEAIPDLMFLQTADGVYLDYHAANRESLYLSPEKFLGKNMRDTLPPELAEKFAHYFKRAIETGETQIVEYTLTLPAGERWYESRLVETDGNILSVVRDITERKHAVDAVRESESRLRRAQRAAKVATWEWDIASGQSVWSDMLWELLGLAPANGSATVERFVNAIHPEDREGALQRVKEVLENGEEYDDEFRIIRSNGDVLWLASKGRLIRSTDGRAERMIGVNIDITERHRALDELRESEERFGKAFRSNPQPMTISTFKRGVYIDVNDSFLAMSGFSREEVIGHSSLALGVWSQPEKRAEFMELLLRQGSLRNVETTFHTNNGSDRVLLSSAELVEIGGEDCVLIASSDITERILAQQALVESEQRFRLMADTAPVMIWVADTDMLCTYVNQQWLGFTGRTMEQELGNGWVEGIHPDDHKGCLNTFVAAYERREQFRMEYRLRRFDGQYRWIFDRGAPRFSSTGKFLGYIGSALDITDRKESEEAAANAHEELMIAHDEVQRLKAQLEEENIYLQEEIRLAKNFGEMVGESDAIKYVMFKVNHVAVTDSTVLITGETGTGKELVARAIHSASGRGDRPLITVNCAALPPTLIESELFGHEKGAFTGATSRKPGRFELADGGTIFLDEVGELPLESQVKLLRVIQEGELQRLGGSNPIKVDVRLIAATNRNLRREIERGAFREDLWYRLNVFPITVPPLRQRREDIPLLVEHFVANYANKFGKTITSISPQAMQKLQEHSWPGNVRELANVIERATIYTQGTVLNLVDVFEQPRETATDSLAMKSLEEVEREYIMHILEHTSWRIEGPRGAAKLLGMNPSTLRTRMIKLGIHKNNSNVNGH